MIYVTGYKGNLGQILVQSFHCNGLDCDVTSIKSISQALCKAKSIDVIINCAAFTDVDECELDGGRSIALRTNAGGVANLREVFDGRIIHISTDYIFDGKNGPYSETDEPSPINWYGQTKLCGEERLLEFNFTGDVIVRTTILYGGYKTDFALKVLRKLHEGETVSVPSNVKGTPTHVFHLAKALMDIIMLKHPPKIINIVGDNFLSRYEFAMMLAHRFGYMSDKIIPVTTFPYIAKRPERAGLKTTLARKLKIPIYSISDGIEQLYLERAHLYARE